MAPKIDPTTGLTDRQTWSALITLVILGALLLGGRISCG